MMFVIVGDEGDSRIAMNEVSSEKFRVESRHGFELICPEDDMS